MVHFMYGINIRIKNEVHVVKFVQDLQDKMKQQIPQREDEKMRGLEKVFASG